MSYESQTKNAYRNKIKAKDYQDQYIKGSKWARFTMWRQKNATSSLLNLCDLCESDIILDAPCGTGLIGELLNNYSSSVIAADISLEMIELAQSEYEKNKFLGFIQADLTKAPFLNDTFKCVIVLSLMHRLPAEIRKKVLSEVFRLSNHYAVISYSIENTTQKLKQKLLSKLNKSHIPAPSSIPYETILEELDVVGFKVMNKINIAFFLSSKIVLLVKK
jgi:SAM-dependent methyltransferase